MKIKIQYPSNQANPATVEVETDDTGLDPEQQLQHASDALDVALSVVWGDKAKPTEPKSRIELGVGYLNILPNRDSETFQNWLKEALSARTPDGRPLFEVKMLGENDETTDPGE